jgi:hypothetical protein
MLITKDGIKEGVTAHYQGDKILVHHAEEVTEILRANYELRKDRTNGFSEKRHFRLIGTIPNIAYFAILKKYPEIEKGDRFQKQRAWKKALGDPEFSGYRSVEGGI